MRHLFKQALLGAVMCAALSGAALAQTTVAGTTPGQFSVNESGAATYSIPIQVPPGVAGMQPKLSLEYNSQGGNGLLGMGWSLSGLSAVTRCPRTMAQDGVRGGVNYDMNDRFCLDGQRLVLVSGTYGVAGSEYRTERESFNKITAHGNAGNGPAYFTMQTKAGLMMELGNTVDSRIEAQGKPTVRVWALNRVQDVKSNFMTFGYYESADSSVYVPIFANYGGNVMAGIASTLRVDFEYDATRQDKSHGYISGSLVQVDRRMTSIKTYVEAVVTGDYRLMYTNNSATRRSRMINVKKCDGDGSSNCLPPIGFEWQSGGSGQVDAGYQSTPATQFDGTWLASIGDVNADGISDVVRVRDTGDIAVWIGRGDGSFDPAYKSTGINGYAVGGCVGCDWERLIADLNGDGFLDVARVRDTGDIHVFLGNGDGTFSITPVGTAGSQFGTVWHRSFADVNGDGLPDLIRVRDSGDIATWLGKGDGSFESAYKVTDIGGYAVGGCVGCDWERMVVDLNGDGFADVLRVRDTGDIHAFLGKGNGTFSAFPIGIDVSQFGLVWQSMLGDVNGDGVPDVIRVRDSGDIAVWIGRGDGSFDPAYKTTGINGYAIGGCVGCDWQRLSADFNGDGFSDVARVRDTGDIHVFLGNGDGTFFTTPVGVGASQFGAVWRRMLGDVNGDGLPDVVRVRDGGDIVSFKQLSPYPDLLKSVVNLSARTEISTKPLTNNTIYTRDAAPNAAVYPKIDLQYPQYVVSEVKTSNGVGGVNTVQYSYGGLKAEQGTGRGMLGFRWMKSKNLANNIESYTEFNQNWPFTGTVAKNETRLAGSGNAGLLKRTINTYAQSPGSAGATVFVHPGQSIEESWDLGGTPYPSTTSSYVYGQSPQYGDPTQITVSNSEGASKTTVNEYWPADSSNWILGRLKKASVTSVKP